MMSFGTDKQPHELFDTVAVIRKEMEAAKSNEDGAVKLSTSFIARLKQAAASNKVEWVTND